MTRFTRGVALVSLCFLSCDPFGNEVSLEVSLPEPPAHWVRAFSDLRFRLVFPDAAGGEKELVVSDWSAPVRISCSKAGTTPVLAYPASDRSGGFLRPAGGFFPLDLSGSTGDEVRLPLSWESGSAALIVRRLQALGLDTSLVNASRLREFICEHPDPWAVDLDKIVEKLAQGDFCAYDIDLLASRDVQLIPGAGEWFLESPFRGARCLADGETLALPSLSIGMHALFSVKGDLVRIFVGEKETVISR